MNNALIDKAYSDYRESFKDSIVEPYTKEFFIDKCKHNIEYSIKWGLKIEERELSLEERIKTFEPFVTLNTHEECDNIGLPKRAISITYNNERIEIYE
jgi:hypothetical protein